MSPKNLFTQSLVLNLVLLGACAYLLMREPAAEQTAPAPAAVPKTDFQFQEPSHPAGEPVLTAAGRTLRWSDLESADFGAYVSNLRAIGCPEATIRSIVTPKIAAFYEEKRRQAQVAGPKTIGEVRREAQELQREEARAVDNLLGAALPQTNDTAPDAGTAATADGTSFVANQVQPAMFSRFGLPGIQQAPRSAPPAAATPQNGTAPAMTPTPNRSPSPSTAAANSSTSPSGTQAPNPMNSPDAVIPPEDPGGLSDAEYKLLYGEQAFLAYDLSRQAAKSAAAR